MTVRIWGLSKREAHYRPAPTPAVRCDHRKYMFPASPWADAGWSGDRSEAPPHATSSRLAAPPKADLHLLSHDRLAGPGQTLLERAEYVIGTGFA